MAARRSNIKPKNVDMMIFLQEPRVAFVFFSLALCNDFNFFGKGKERASIVCYRIVLIIHANCIYQIISCCWYRPPLWPGKRISLPLTLHKRGCSGGGSLGDGLARCMHIDK